MSGGNDRRRTLELLSESLEALRLADRALLAAAEGLGWMGSGMLTYVRRDDNIMGEGTYFCFVLPVNTETHLLLGLASGRAYWSSCHPRRSFGGRAFVLAIVHTCMVRTPGVRANLPSFTQRPGNAFLSL